MEAAIRAALPDSEVQVRAGGAGHFEVSVVAEAFRGKSMVQQHQLVYGAIAPLLAGVAPPVHAIDRLSSKAP
jgi:stress-induced morphogen